MCHYFPKFLMPKAADGIEVWCNRSDGNDHFVLASEGFLVMQVKKKDGTTWNSGPVATISEPEEWQQAFAGLGPTWNQEDGSEKKSDGHYQAVRTASTLSERAMWTVDHTLNNERYTVRDLLEVVLTM